jgi:N-acetylmuramic acid 6-phosphate etherase
MADQHDSYLIGIDGGGTKTVALLADLEGRVIGRGIAGPSNYQVAGLQAAADALKQAMHAAFADAQLEPRLPCAMGLGLAGVDRPDDFAAIRAWAAEHLPGVRTVIVNDAMIVLAAGTPQGWGIAMISGTGSIVYGRDRAGRMARAGGWGHLLGDEGSGFAIGLAALRAVARADDGRAPQTALTRMILSQWTVPAPQDLIGRVYLEHVPTQDIALLAALVEAAASEGDAVAQNILKEASQELALAVWAVVKRLGLQPPIPCALAGSMIVKGQVVRQLLLESAQSMGLTLNPVTPVTEPAEGALRLAARLIGR